MNLTQWATTSSQASVPHRVLGHNPGRPRPPPAAPGRPRLGQKCYERSRIGPAYPSFAI